jgi:riboflavin kinase/FMN adenylyltransferase
MWFGEVTHNYATRFLGGSFSHLRLLLARLRRRAQDNTMSTVTLDWSAYAPRKFVGGAVTVGNFDGVHLGHRALINAAREQADFLNGPAIAVTFDPPPHQVLFPGPLRPPLTILSERAELLHEARVDHVVILRTSPALLALCPEAFFEDVLVRQLGAKAIVEGHDFRFGRNRAGNNETLRQLCTATGLVFAEVPQLLHGGEPVSSSRVRAAILQGDVGLAAELLARPHRVTGTVITGAKRGRTIGFPTANLGDVSTVLPGNGVYAVRALVDGQKYPAATNVGPNPTFGENAQKIEVHLIGFSGDLYGKALVVEFIARLRDTRPFASVDELIEQLKRDVEEAKSILG